MLRNLISLPPKCCRAAAGLAASQVDWSGLKLGCVASNSRVAPSAPALVLRQWQRRRMPTGPPDMAAAAGSGVAGYSAACRTCRPQPRCRLCLERKGRSPSTSEHLSADSQSTDMAIASHQICIGCELTTATGYGAIRVASHKAGSADSALDCERCVTCSCSSHWLPPSYL